TEYPEAEILVNVSSGTPAMKSALQILAAATDLNIKPLQVSTPNVRSNNPRPCNISEKWERNLDKSPDSPNRVEVSSNKNLLFEFNKKLLISLINSYDYHTAGMLADKMKPFLSLQFCDMLNAMILRYDLKTDEARKSFAACGHGELIKETNLAAEYYMLLDLKVRKKEYTDFLRAFTPLVLEAFYDMAKKSLNVDLTKYTKKENKYYWAEYKLSGSKLDGKFGQQIKYHSKPRPMQEGSFPKKYVLSWHISNLAENLSRDEQLVERTIQIRKFEEDVRNLAAHTMTVFTEAEIVKETGTTPADMMKELLDYIKTYTTIPVNESSLSVYDDMNKILIELLG
ncbi:MAG: hypothetical protein Q4A05_01545, partial [Ruminococcus sp.]|nr:hypothetical protein [Ruminococcus sp.]